MKSVTGLGGVGHVTLPINTAEGVFVGAGQINLPPLLSGQYYRITDMQVWLESAGVNNNAVGRRDDTFCHIVSKQTAAAVLVAGNLSPVRLAQSSCTIGYSLVNFAPNSVNVSDLQNPHIAQTPLGFTDLDMVNSGVEVWAVYQRGDLILGNLEVWISYDVVTLSDGERITLLQRCECSVN